MPESEVTLGEVNRNVQGLAGRLDAMASQLSAVPSWTDLERTERHLTEKLQRAEDQLGDRVGDLEGTTTWLGRAVIGGVVLALLGAILVPSPLRKSSAGELDRPAVVVVHEAAASTAFRSAPSGTAV